MTELEKKQADCPYCHNEPKQENLLVEFTKEDMVIVFLRANTLVLEAMDYMKSKEINYCPMCGRKLGEDE